MGERTWPLKKVFEHFKVFTILSLNLMRCNDCFTEFSNLSSVFKNYSINPKVVQINTLQKKTLSHKKVLI